MVELSNCKIPLIYLEILNWSMLSAIHKLCFGKFLAGDNKPRSERKKVSTIDCYIVCFLPAFWSSRKEEQIQEKWLVDRHALCWPHIVEWCTIRGEPRSKCLASIGTKWKPTGRFENLNNFEKHSKESEQRYKLINKWIPGGWPSFMGFRLSLSQLHLDAVQSIPVRCRFS